MESISSSIIGILLGLIRFDLEMILHRPDLSICESLVYLFDKLWDKFLKKARICTLIGYTSIYL